MNHAAQLARLAAWYETLTPRTLPALTAIYAPDALFKDPFNEVRGHAAIAAIFEHMFARLDAPRFVLASRIAQGDEAFLTWEFHFNLKRKGMVGPALCIRGATHLRFDGDGLVALHRDYWDVAEELYEKLPLLGACMRLLKRAAQR